MIAEWRTYSVEDFIPFTPEVYFRLIERVNEAQWPLHLLMLAGGTAVVVLLSFGRGRTAGTLLAAAWVWVGVAFFIQRYAELNWAGAWFGRAFCIQALVLSGCALAGRFKRADVRHFSGPQWLGGVLIAYGLLFYPLIAVLSGDGWSRSESFGIHADPTAIATLGILLVATKGWSLWISGIIPILWCIAGGLTLWVLEASWAAGLLFVAALALSAMVWKSFLRKSAERTAKG